MCVPTHIVMIGEEMILMLSYGGKGALEGISPQDP